MKRGRSADIRARSNFRMIVGAELSDGLRNARCCGQECPRSARPCSGSPCLEGAIATLWSKMIETDAVVFVVDAAPRGSSFHRTPSLVVKNRWTRTRIDQWEQGC